MEDEVLKSEYLEKLFKTIAMPYRFSKHTVQNYFINRIDCLEKKYAFDTTACQEEVVDNNEEILKAFGEYVALVRALYDLLRVVY